MTSGLTHRCCPTGVKQHTGPCDPPTCAQCGKLPKHFRGLGAAIAQCCNCPPRAATYVIRSVADFLAVPEDRLDDCLREFRVMLEVARTATALVGAVCDETLPADHGVTFPLTRFEWIDDGRTDMTMNIRTPEHNDA